MDRIIRKARIIELHPNIMNREAGFDLEATITSHPHPEEMKNVLSKNKS
jgi:hypothetical protein